MITCISVKPQVRLLKPQFLEFEGVILQLVDLVVERDSPCLTTYMTWALLQEKAVIVIGGGDTGTDCIGTSVRHGAKQVRPNCNCCCSVTCKCMSLSSLCTPTGASLLLQMKRGLSAVNLAPARRCATQSLQQSTPDHWHAGR